MQDIADYGHPKTSAYMQTALVFFARGLEEAKRHARKVLGSPAAFCRQVGRADIDLARTTRNIMTGADSDVKRLHVMDMGDTNEGAVVSEERLSK